jgi:hypothetical protein
MNKVETSRAAATAVEINKLSESRDLDACLGYLSLVSGIDGAILYSEESLVVAAGENTLESLFIEAPYFLANFLETLRHGRLLGLGAPQTQITFGDQRFHEIINLERSGRFFLVVTGTRGSYELFRVRIDRGAQAVSHLLHERGYLRS